MHTVELLDQAIALAKQCGIVVRQDWFGGAAAGACEFKGRHWVFIDLALTPQEQLEQVLVALDTCQEADRIETAPKLRKVLTLRKAA